MFKLDRPIVTLDVEGTGVDPVRDRIVELTVIRMEPDSQSGKCRTWRVNPGVPIPLEATECHGITDADVADCPPFSHVAADVLSRVAGCDLVGYNLRRYDLPILWEEFFRAGSTWNIESARVVDVAGVYFKKNPRTLADCYREYCGEELAGAHGSKADAIGTWKALLGQIKRHADLEIMTIDQLADFSRMSDLPTADLAGKFVIDADGRWLFNFGNKRGQPITDDLKLARWVLQRDFPAQTKAVLREEIMRLECRQH